MPATNEILLSPGARVAPDDEHVPRVAGQARGDVFRQRRRQRLDDQVDQLSKAQPVDFLTLSKLKKDKLRVKDTIQRIESMLIPDILA